MVAGDRMLAQPLKYSLIGANYAPDLVAPFKYLLTAGYQERISADYVTAEATHADLSIQKLLALLSQYLPTLG